MADFQALQQKYAPVVDTVKEFEPYGAKFVVRSWLVISITLWPRFHRKWC